MLAFLTQNYDVIVAGAGVLGSVGWLSYRVGLWQSSRRISHRLRTDREFGIAILEDLAVRWGVKVERNETPGGP